MQDSDSDASPLSRLSSWIKKKWKFFRRGECENSLRETIEELIEEREDSESPIESDEKTLLGNVLSLRDLTSKDVMIPRADIIAIPCDVRGEDLLKTFIQSGLQRLPIYGNTLDEVLGSVHIQDVLTWHASGQPLHLSSLLQQVLFISPAMRTLDLIFKMRESGTKMALVVDEFGGIDGLVTFSDLMEEIIGDIQEAQEPSAPHYLFKRPDGNIIADGRVMLEEIQETFGLQLIREETEDEVETIGGFVSSLVGYVPVRGELIQYDKPPVTFEILEADPRRVKRILIHKKSE